MEIKKSDRQITREMLQQAWKKACEFDGIDGSDPKNMFVIFSKKNPHAVEYNALMGTSMDQRKANQIGSTYARHNLPNTSGMKY